MHEIDIYIGILCSRIGSPTANKYISGTVEEFWNIYNLL